MSFKQYIEVNANQPAEVPLNESRGAFSKREIISAFDNAGIQMAASLLQHTDVEYAGYDAKQRSHVYFVATFNDDDRSWDVNRFEVFCGRSGEIEAEFDPMPINTGLSEKDAKALAKRAKK